MTGALQAVDTGHERLDQPAEEVLLQRWEPVIRRLARRYGPAADLEDLEQVARLTLLQAARRFDPARGCRFSTFAIPTIVGGLLHYLRDQARGHGIPRRWWNLRPRLQPAAQAISQEAGHKPTIAELAEWLGVSEEDVVGALAVVELGYPASLDERVVVAPGEESIALVEQVGALDPQLEAAELRVVVRQAIERLPGRLREIIQRRFFQCQSQQSVGRDVGLCQMQISRLERQALTGLRHELDEASRLRAQDSSLAPPRRGHSSAPTARRGGQGCARRS